MQLLLDLSFKPLLVALTAIALNALLWWFWLRKTDRSKAFVLGVLMAIVAVWFCMPSTVLLLGSGGFITFDWAKHLFVIVNTAIAAVAFLISGLAVLSLRLLDERLRETGKKRIARVAVIAALLVFVCRALFTGPHSLPDTEVVIGFTPDSKWIATAAAERGGFFKRGPLTLRSTENGDVFRQFANDVQTIGIVQFSSNGEFVSAVCGGLQRVWRIADGEEIERDPSVYIRSFLQPEGQELQLLTCTNSGKGSFRIESFASGQILHEGSRLVGGDGIGGDFIDGIGGFYDAIMEPIKLQRLKPSQSGKYAVARTVEGIQLWGEGQEKMLGRSFLAAISPDDRYFATCHYTREEFTEEIVFELFDVATGKKIDSQTWTGSSLNPSRHIYQNVPDPDKITFFGKTLVADKHGSDFTVFDTTAGKLDLVINQMTRDPYVVSPDGKWCSYPAHTGDPRLISAKVLPDVVPVRIEVAPPANLPSSFAWTRWKASQFPLAFSEDGKKLACFDRKRGFFILSGGNGNDWSVGHRMRGKRGTRILALLGFNDHSLATFSSTEFSSDGKYFRSGPMWWRVP